MAVASWHLPQATAAAAVGWLGTIGHGTAISLTEKVGKTSGDVNSRPICVEALLLYPHSLTPQPIDTYQYSPRTPSNAPCYASNPPLRSIVFQGLSPRLCRSILVFLVHILPKDGLHPNGRSGPGFQFLGSVRMIRAGSTHNELEAQYNTPTNSIERHNVLPRMNSILNSLVNLCLRRGCCPVRKKRVTSW